MKSGVFQGCATRRENFSRSRGANQNPDLQMGKIDSAGTRKKFAARGGEGEGRRQKAE